MMYHPLLLAARRRAERRALAFYVLVLLIALGALWAGLRWWLV